MAHITRLSCLVRYIQYPEAVYHDTIKPVRVHIRLYIVVDKNSLLFLLLVA